MKCDLGTLSRGRWVECETSSEMQNCGGRLGGFSGSTFQRRRPNGRCRFKNGRRQYYRRLPENKHAICLSYAPIICSSSVPLSSDRSSFSVPTPHARGLRLSRSIGEITAARQALGKGKSSLTWWLPGARERPLYRPQEMVQMGPFKVSPMGFGTWAWGNKLLWDYDPRQDAELQETFNLALQSGINFFDTADSYGTGKLEGRSEELLGKFLKEYPGSEKVKNQVKIGTKLAAYPWRVAPGQWVGAMKSSLKRMGLEKIGLAQLHWSTANYAPLQERLMWDGLVAIYEAGIVEAVGVSNYGPRQLEKISKYLEKRQVPLAAVQVQYSLLSRGPRQQDVKAACDDLGLALIAYSPLALGILSGKYSLEDPSSLPGGPRGYLFKQILPGLRPLTEVLGEIAKARKKTPSQIAINWCMTKGTIPIPGAKNLRQAEQNLGALGWRLSEGEVLALENAADRVPRQMQQNIFATK